MHGKTVSNEGQGEPGHHGPHGHYGPHGHGWHRGPHGHHGHHWGHRPHFPAKFLLIPLAIFLVFFTPLGKLLLLVALGAGVFFAIRHFSGHGGDWWGSDSPFGGEKPKRKPKNDDYTVVDEDGGYI